MAHDLPAPVRGFIEDQARGRALAGLRARHAGVSDHYRAGGASSGVISSPETAAAYALARLPATHASASAALHALAAARPGLAPASVLDLGCGPGTALVAALAVFPDLAEVAGLDHNRHFLDFAGRLLDASGLAAGREVILRPGDLAGAFDAAPADLVLVSYALVELAEAAALAAVRRAWALARGALVLVEPGSRAGFARIHAARGALVAAGATIAAPCTHAGACPVAEPDWCHFAVRLQRSRVHRLVKGAEAPFEDEKFSYLVAVRGGAEPGGRRIIAPARHGKAGHQFRTCGADGIAEMTIGPRDPAFKAAKKRDWGDVI